MRAILKPAAVLILASLILARCGGSGSEEGNIPILSSSRTLTSFSIADPLSPGTIDNSSKTVYITVPYGTDLTSLVASFTTTGDNATVKNILQISGTTANNFTSPVIYRITAEDDSYTDYTVTVRQLAGVTTTAIKGNLTYTVDITGTTAKGAGEVTFQGDSAVTERGLCWNTGGSPTINDAHSASGSGTGVFTGVSINGLSINTTHYVRAYATNSEGTAYGNEITFNSGRTFGTDHAGGLVFYNDGNGGGLVSAKTDQSTGIQWYNGDTITTGATDKEIGKGQSNTTKIVTSQGDGSYAAKLCDDYFIEGTTYDDWFLPSQNELNLMYTRLHLNGFGGYNSVELKSYWSSSEQLESTAWAQVFYDGQLCDNGKFYSAGLVRAIRVF